MKRADQLAEPALSFVEGLKQGPPGDESVPPLGQPAGVQLWETKHSWTHESAGTIYSV